MSEEGAYGLDLFRDAEERLALSESLQATVDAGELLKWLLMVASGRLLPLLAHQGDVLAHPFERLGRGPLAAADPVQGRGQVVLEGLAEGVVFLGLEISHPDDPAPGAPFDRGARGVAVREQGAP